MVLGKVLVAQSCLTLCDPMDCSLPGFSVHGILPARILKWVAVSFPGDLPNPGQLGMGLYAGRCLIAGRFFTV